MTTCRSKLGLVLGAALSFAGCAEIGTLGTPGGTESGVTRFDIMEGYVRVATPRGYCVDPRSSRPGFVLAARCDRLGVKGRFAAQEIAIVTVTAVPTGNSGAPDAAVLANLSSDADVLESSTRGNLALVRLKPSATAGAEQARYHWRGAFEVRGHLVGLTLYAPEGSNLAGAEGARLLADFADGIQRESVNLPAARSPVRSRRPLGRPGTTLAQKTAQQQNADDAA